MSRGQTKLKRATAAIALTLALALLAACGGLGDVGGVGAGGQIIGEIKDKDTGHRIADREVTVTAGGRTTTTEDGFYSLKGVPTGPQTIEATADGYVDYSAAISVPSGELSHNIEMTQVSATVTGQVVAPPTNVAALHQPTLWQRAVALLRAPVAQAALTGEVPLAGATVKAFNWATGLQIGSSTTTDGNGSFTLSDIPVGTNVLIEVTLGEVRLSSVVPEVGESEIVDVNTVSTLTAEALSESYKHERLDIDSYDAVAQRITDWVAGVDIDAIDLRAGAGWIGDVFGASNLHQELLTIRTELVQPMGEIAQAKRFISTVRNLAPSLMAYGAPVVEKAADTINEKVGPALVAVVDRLAIIAGLVEDADLEPLDEGEEFTFADEEHSLDVILSSVEDLGEDVKKVTAEFTISEIGSEDPFSAGTMIFEIADGRPVDEMVLDVTLFESVDEDTTVAVEFDAEITFEWATDLVGDIRDLQKITIHGGQIDSEEENLMTGFGTLIADLGQRVEGDTTYVVVSSLQLIGGIIEVEDITIDGNFTYTLTSPGLDEYDLTASVTITSSNYDEEDFRIYGYLTADGVALLEEETESSYASTDAAFSGQIQVPDRRRVTIGFNADRNELYGFQLQNLAFTDGEVDLNGHGSIVTTPGAPGETKLYETLELTLNLTDNDGYTFDFTLSIDDGQNAMTADGELRSPSGKLLAVVEPKGVTGAEVTYLHDHGDHEIHSLF